MNHTYPPTGVLFQLERGWVRSGRKAPGALGRFTTFNPGLSLVKSIPVCSIFDSRADGGKCSNPGIKGAYHYLMHCTERIGLSSFSKGPFGCLENATPICVCAGPTFFMNPASTFVIEPVQSVPEQQSCIIDPVTVKLFRFHTNLQDRIFTGPRKRAVWSVRDSYGLWL